MQGVNKEQGYRTIEEMLHSMAHFFNRSSLALMNEHELTVPQIIGLHILEAHNEDKSCTVSELAEMLMLSRAAGSHMIERLVQRGLLERTEDEHDRRQKLLRITEKGRHLSTLFAESRFMALSEILKMLSPETVQRFVSLADTVLAELKANGYKKPDIGSRHSSRFGAKGEKHA